jgi:endoglucanase Acf2
LKPITRITFKNFSDPANSFNFAKLYIEAIKMIPIKGYYNNDKVLDFIFETMSILYNLGVYNLF